MMYTTQETVRWVFPGCPERAPWVVDWPALLQRFSWLRAMDGVPQSPVYHAEGDVLIHTRMVVEALLQHPAWQELPSFERQLLFVSALLHDVGKPDCTRVEEDGRITSRGHARKGEYMTRNELFLGTALSAPVPFSAREYIAKLVRYHGLPLQFLDNFTPERSVMAASQSVRLDHLALLSEVDVRGRICSDQDELLERIELFRLFCQEQQCYTAPRAFADAHSRFIYFHSEHGDPNYAAYDATTCEVILMVGLPGAGKDTWIQQHYADWPVISLDDLRKELKIAAEDNQGQVVQLARERARALLRKQRSFVWNATNTTKMLRGQLIDLFVGYGARVHIVYVETSMQDLLSRNATRQAMVPEQVIYKLLRKLEVPDCTEAHIVEWITG